MKLKISAYSLFSYLGVKSKGSLCLSLALLSFGYTASGSANTGWKSIPDIVDTTLYFKWHVAQSNSDWSMVPINYSNEDVDQAALAVIKLPVPSETEYKGAILMNPGGPGGSVVAILVPQSDHWTAAFNTQHPTSPRLWAFAQVIAKVAEERDKGFMNCITSTNEISRDPFRLNEEAGQAKIQCWGFSYTTVLGSAFALMFPVHSLIYHIFQATDYSFNFQDKVGHIVLNDSFAHTKQTYWIWIAIITAMRPFRALKPPHIIFLSSDDRSDNTEDADADIQSFFDGCVSTGPDISTFYSSAATEMSNSLNYLYKSVLTQPVPSSPYTVLGLTRETVA
ncbi:hypothetical protein EDD18DRAFT_1110966 [Armillaria luteobubalina]|uniref:Uncharacterized protein n=1 Tax=Armillaria luteobubalina TaxID=153913 RepID=A0AA39UP30_9AGAR|nr:hypothetical protein EDD18DRAFT_1110966 [Armillaria luteobubalina]